MHLDNVRLLSAPIPIRFAGWESTTYRLQQSGWQLSAMEQSYADHQRPKLQLALQHPDLQVKAMTRPMEIDYMMIAQRRGMSLIQSICAMGLDVAAFGSQVVLNVMHQGPIDFRPIDAQPMYQDIERIDLDELRIFADAQLVRTEEVVVMPDSVPELMAHILKLQNPQQQAIRDRARKDKLLAPYREIIQPEQRFHAQIVTFA